MIKIFQVWWNYGCWGWSIILEYPVGPTSYHQHLYKSETEGHTHTHVKAHAHMGSWSGHKAEKDLKMFTLKSAVIWHYWGMLAGRPRNTSWEREGMDLVLEPSEGAQLWQHFESDPVILILDLWLPGLWEDEYLWL